MGGGTGSGYAVEPWVIGLEKNPMDRIRHGLKQFEFRLNKEKWFCIRPGDSIEFQLRNADEVLETLLVDVVDVVRRPTFRELLKHVYTKGWSEQGRNLEDQLKSLETRYDETERQEYDGVVGFRVRPRSTNR